MGYFQIAFAQRRRDFLCRHGGISGGSFGRPHDHSAHVTHPTASHSDHGPSLTASIDFFASSHTSCSVCTACCTGIAVSSTFSVPAYFSVGTLSPSEASSEFGFFFDGPYHPPRNILA